MLTLRAPLLGLLVCVLLTTTSATGRAAPTAGLRVVGNRLVDRVGHVVTFHGVNRSGTEYTCIQGNGIFDGPSDARSIHAMTEWHVNAVRVPLNEDCWLGLNGVRKPYAGAVYRRAIVGYVRLLERSGIYPELSLIWGAPATYAATYQPGAPDEDHAPAFWSSLASTFRNDTNLVLAPWGETVVNARCFLRGGVCEATYGPSNKPYATAGMQQAVTLMRRAGYRGVIAIPGLDYANDLTHWLRYQPRDPLHQLIAEMHVYGKNTCGTAASLDRAAASVARHVPLILGETGETYDGSGCGSSHIAEIMRWADAHGVGYEAWTWDTWDNCEALIADYGGTPRGTYGAWVKSHYATFP